MAVSRTENPCFVLCAEKTEERHVQSWKGAASRPMRYQSLQGFARAWQHRSRRSKDRQRHVRYKLLM